jgi:geranylgeranyl reductase family protein
MKHVAVLGGGPAGAHTAERLAAAGLRVTLLDEKLAWEKPCGGGITYKAYHQYPFLLNNNTPKKFVSETYLEAAKTGRVRMELNQPLLIYSRQELNGMLLRRAEEAGAQIEKTRVLEVTPTSGGWRIRTRHGALEADYCVVATGARNPLKDLGTVYSAEDSCVALGYYVPSEQPHIDIRFFEKFEGYIWVFPRCGHLSAGICGKGESAQAMRQRLERYLTEQGIRWQGSQFYAHMLPSLESRAWRNNRVAGERWLAVGDAAGLVDPITGEGLYYAVRSGDLASQVVLDEAHAPEAKAAAYRALVEKDFMRDLFLASLIARRMFLGRFLFESVPTRMVQFVRRSPRFRALMQDLFAGTQNYEGLRERLWSNLNGTLQEVIMSFFFRRIVPEASKI